MSETGSGMKLFRRAGKYGCATRPKPLWRIGLSFGRRRREGSLLAGRRVGRGDARIGRQIEAGAPRVIDLGHEANVGQGNLVSDGVAPGEGCEARFDRAKPKPDP